MSASVGNNMRAVVIDQNGGPETLKISDAPLPEPGEGQVRILVAYCALNPPRPLTDIAQAHDDFEQRRTMGRTIFTIAGEI